MRVGAGALLGAMLWVVFACPMVLSSEAEDPTVDAKFAAVPYEEWVKAGARAELPWHTRITAPELTLHERLASRVQVDVDGNELLKRCCEGEEVALLEIHDQQGRTYRNYAAKSLKDVQPGFSGVVIDLSWQVFLLPGDYEVAIALYYSGRAGHSLVKERLHVAELKRDPLPDAWRGLPSVEFCDPQPEGINEFVLPNIRGRLNLPAAASHSLHLGVVENVTPYPSQRRHTKDYMAWLGNLLPILKTLGQVDVRKGTMDISLLDFTRSRAVFEQQVAEREGISWGDLRSALAANPANLVDVHDLPGQEHFGDFFESIISTKLASRNDDEATRVLIVISGRMDLGNKRPIAIPIATGGKFEVFYLRCDLENRVPRTTWLYGREIQQNRIAIERLVDGVGDALKPVKPRVFEIDSPMALRVAVATILNEIAKM